MIMDTKPPKNVSIKWLTKLPDGYQKKDCTHREYAISFERKGTLLDPRLYAIVNISYLTPNKKFGVQSVSGPSAEVYSFFLLNSQKKHLFKAIWHHQKNLYHKKNKTLFPQASSGEKLSEKLTSDGMTPKKFAEKTKKDYTQVFRELRGTRPLSLKQGIEYAKELDCDPVDLLFEDLRCHIWGSVNLYEVRDLGNDKFFPCQINPVVNKTTIVPRSIYKPNIMAIKINSPGSWLDNQTAFYYRTDREEETHNGKLVVAKTTDDELADIGFEREMYWFGIYNIEKGGKQQILNPDRNAEKQLIVTGPFEFIAPVVSLVHPKALEKDYDYYMLNSRAHAYHKYQQYQEKIKEQQMQISQLLIDKTKMVSQKVDRAAKQDDAAAMKEAQAEMNGLEKDIHEAKERLIKVLEEQEKDYEIPDFVKKSA